jgi:hypothetical protein
VIILVILLLDIYVFQAVKTVFIAQSGIHPAQIIYWVLCGFTYLTFVLFAILGREGFHGLPRVILLGISQSFLVLKLVVLPFLLISDIIRIGEIVMLKFQSAPESTAANAISRSKFLNKIGLLAGTAFFGAFIYGVVRGAYNVVIKRVTVKIPNLPSSLSGLKIVQISDLHLGSFASTDPIQRAIDLVNQENADLFFFTGDLVNDRAKEAEPFVEILRTIKAKYGKYSILGNHDYGDYMEWDSQKAKEENLRKLIQTHALSDWKILLDKHETIEINGEKVDILGVQYWGRSMGFGQKGKIDQAYSGTQAPLKLLLSHDPSHWDAVISQDEKYKDVAITFAGHTHGFQFGIEIPGFRWSPSQYVYPHWAGLYTSKQQHLYVNRGLGFLGYPGRVGIPPEITVVTIERG